MKLVIQHLTPYLPYGLNIMRPDGKTILEVYGLVGSLICHTENNELTYSGFTGSKPLFHPLSNYTDINGSAMCELNTDIPIQMQICDLANKRIGYWNCCYEAIETMAKAHIDFYRLIDSGLAIPITQ